MTVLMKNLLFPSVAAVSLLAFAGCASDMSSNTTSTRTTYVATSNDPKDMNTEQVQAAPAPEAAPAATEQDYPSNGIHTSGNLPGMR